MGEQLAERLDGEWVMARYGVQRPQFLSKLGKWGIIASAASFIDQATAQAALCPPGTTGIAVRMAPVAGCVDAPGTGIVANVRKAFEDLQTIVGP
jgi:hypothetical protein